ncbi:MAG: thioesterase [Planctomycetota bacterium]
MNDTWLSVPEPLPPLPTAGRVFAQARTVELGDVTPAGRMRFDAVARFLQDAAMADVCDAGLDEPAWIVRRTAVHVTWFPRYLERLEVRTHCWSMGKFAAERRTVLVGAQGGHVDTLTLWVRLDPSSGRPAPLAADFRACFAEAVAGRVTDHELRHAAPPARAGAGFALRACDFDLRGHVNNAVLWAPVEDVLAACGFAAGHGTFEMEFRAAIAPGAAVEIVTQDETQGTALWVVADGKASASARLFPGRP